MGGETGRRSRRAVRGGGQNARRAARGRVRAAEPAEPVASVPSWRNGIILRALSVVVVALLGLGLFLTTPIFGIEEIVVLGAQHLTTTEVAGLCGVTIGTNLLKVPTGAIRERLEAHPRVESVTVARRLPDRLVITIVERAGVALLAAVEGYVELDRTGRAVELHHYIGALGLPLVTGVIVEGVTLGSRVGDDHLAPALLLAAELGLRGRRQVAEIHLAGSGELILYTSQGIPVYVGPPTGLGPKIQAFLGVLPDLESGEFEVTYVDVRYPRFPVVGSTQQVIETLQWPGTDPDAELLGGP